LVDSSQNIIIKEDDCNTVHHKKVVAGDKKSSFDENFEERIYSRTIAVDVKDSKGKVILPS
jgi:DNA-directed RNA polymerase beta' subunit